MKSDNASHKRESVALEGLSGFLILLLFPQACYQIFIEMLSLKKHNVSHSSHTHTHQQPPMYHRLKLLDKELTVRL